MNAILAQNTVKMLFCKEKYYKRKKTGMDKLLNIGQTMVVS